MSALGTKNKPIPLDERPTITDRAMYEIVDGQLVEMEKMSMYAMSVSFALAALLHEYVRTNRLGSVSMEMLFRLPTKTPRCRRPDVAFVSAQRWPLDKPLPIKQNAWDVVPDLAVEVVCPHDRAMKLERKLSEYFEAGVTRVWVVHPEHKIVELYSSRYEIKVFKADEHLVDEAVLPGFRLAVHSIFPPQLAPTDQPAAG